VRAYVGDLLTAGATRVVAFGERLEPPSDEVILAGPVRGQFVLRGTGGTVYVHGRVSAVAGLICGACLARFSQALEVDVDEEFGHRTTVPPDRDRAGDGREFAGPAAVPTARPVLSPRRGQSSTHGVDQHRRGPKPARAETATPHGSRAGGGDANEQVLGPDDFIAPIGSGDLVDLTELVRQHLALAIPISPRCSPTCKGLCPKCGADRNAGGCDCDTEEVDPRLEGLRQWTGDGRPRSPRGRAGWSAHAGKGSNRWG